MYLDEPWTIENSNFDPAQPTVVFIHGFTERAMGASGRTIKDGKSNFHENWQKNNRFFISAYLKKGNYNVILVDWGPLSGFPYYASSAKNTRIVGPYVARFLVFLENIGAARVHHIHVIGFSLGAEVAGFTGKTLGPGVLPRITGKGFLSKYL